MERAKLHNITWNEWTNERMKKKNYILYNTLILKDTKTMLPIQCNTVPKWWNGWTKKMGFSDTQTHAFVQNVKSTAFNVKQSNQKTDAAVFSFGSIGVRSCSFFCRFAVLGLYICVVSVRYIFWLLFRITPSKKSKKKERFESSGV